MWQDMDLYTTIKIRSYIYVRTYKLFKVVSNMEYLKMSIEYSEILRMKLQSCKWTKVTFQTI